MTPSPETMTLTDDDDTHLLTQFIFLNCKVIFRSCQFLDHATNSDVSNLRFKDHVLMKQIAHAGNYHFGYFFFFLSFCVSFFVFIYFFLLFMLSFLILQEFKN